MAVPELTKEDRLKALEKAKASRLKRAEIRRQLADRKLTPSEVIDMRKDEVIGRMKVSAFIEAVPGFGKAKSAKIMKEINIAESRRLRGLGQRQIEELLARLER